MNSGLKREVLLLLLTICCAVLADDPDILPTTPSPDSGPGQFVATLQKYKPLVISLALVFLGLFAAFIFFGRFMGYGKVMSIFCRVLFCNYIFCKPCIKDPTSGNRNNRFAPMNAARDRERQKKEKAAAALAAQEDV